MERIKSEEIYRGRVINLRKDTLRLPDGKEIQRDVVEHGGAVVIVAEEGGDLLFVRQYRYAAGESLLELVAGTREPGEDPAVTAGRELQEEAGYKAGKITKIGEFYSAPGFCSELLHLYLAEDLTPSRLPGDEDEEIEVERYSLAEAIRMALAGEMRDAKTLAGVLLYAQHRAAR
ncbi:MAG TPA: NUDIX hydrolase [Symbiobacteriaceae bacterium]|jgi:ADP-ribose pyrophosphatase|nr:NUDIX hydrolase [Symbiobacteriaceae bacterium]